MTNGKALHQQGFAETRQEGEHAAGGVRRLLDALGRELDKHFLDCTIERVAAAATR